MQLDMMTRQTADRIILLASKETLGAVDIFSQCARRLTMYAE
jgi:hypothetical protein